MTDDLVPPIINVTVSSSAGITVLAEELLPSIVVRPAIITASVLYQTPTPPFINVEVQPTESVIVVAPIAFESASVILDVYPPIIQVNPNAVTNAVTASVALFAFSSSVSHVVSSSVSSSLADFATSASFATTAAFAMNGGGSSITSSYSITSSFAQNVEYNSILNKPTLISSSFQINTGSFTGSFKGNGSELLGVVSSSYAVTSSHAEFAKSASTATSITFTPTTSSYALTASFALNVPATASYALLAQTASYFSGTADFVGGLIVTGSVRVSGNIDNTGYAHTASAFKGDGSQITGVISSSYALTASIALNVPTTASYAVSSSHAQVVPFTGIYGLPTLISSSFQINTGSFTGSFKGDGSQLTGIISSSYAVTASAATSITFTPATASFAQNALTANSATSASYAITSAFAQTVMGSGVSGQVASALSSSYANSVEASHITGTPFTKAQLPAAVAYEDESNVFIANQTITGSLLVSGNTDNTGYAHTASAFKGDGSQVTGVVSSSYALTSSAATSITFVPATSSYAITASYADSVQASKITGTPFTKAQLPSAVAYEDEANVFTANQTITGSLLVSGNIDNTGYAHTASAFKGDGSQITGIVSASYAVSSSYALVSQNVLGTITSASYAITSSHALMSVTASYFSGTADLFNGLTVSGTLRNTGSTELTGSLTIKQTIAGPGPLYLAKSDPFGRVEIDLLDNELTTLWRVGITAGTSSQFKFFDQTSDVLILNRTSTGSIQASRSLFISGNIDATGYSITASAFKGDGSQVTNIVSSSYAITSSMAATSSFSHNIISVKNDLLVSGTVTISGSGPTTGIQLIGSGTTLHHSLDPSSFYLDLVSRDGTNSTALAVGSNLYLLIDSNNNNTDRNIIIKKDGSVPSSGTEVFRFDVESQGGLHIGNTFTAPPSGGLRTEGSIVSETSITASSFQGDGSLITGIISSSYTLTSSKATIVNAPHVIPGIYPSGAFTYTGSLTVAPVLRVGNRETGSGIIDISRVGGGLGSGSLVIQSIVLGGSASFDRGGFFFNTLWDEPVSKFKVGRIGANDSHAILFGNTGNYAMEFVYHPSTGDVGREISYSDYLNSGSALRIDNNKNIQIGVRTNPGGYKLRISGSVGIDGNTDVTGSAIINQILTVGSGSIPPDLTTGDILASQGIIAISSFGSSNIDHLWFDDVSNTWHFVADSTRKAVGNANIKAGSITGSAFNGDGSQITGIVSSSYAVSSSYSKEGNYLFVPLNSFYGLVAELRDVPSTVTEWDTSQRLIMNLHNFSKIRVGARAEHSSSVGTAVKVALQYSTNETSWSFLGIGVNAPSTSIDVLGTKIGDWFDITNAVKTGGDIFIRWVTVAGTGVEDIRLGTITLQAK